MRSGPDPRRVYVGLTAMHWFAVGLVVPVLILTLQARGLGLALVGVLYTVNGILTGALELPTGGLADAHGRRPVLVASSLATAGALLLLGLGPTLPVLLPGLLLLATGRALSSGPLESWYVDSVLAEDPDADLTPGLGAGARALGLGLGLGTLVGGLLPSLATGLPNEGGALLLRTSVPFVVAAVVLVAEVAVLLVLVAPLPAARRRPGTSARASIGEGLRIGRRSPTTRRILLRYLAAGVAGTAFEILVPVRLAELTGSATTAAAVYGPLSTVGFVGGAFAAGLSGRVRDRAGTPARGALALTVVAGAGGLLAGLPAVAAVAAGSLSLYVLTGPCPALLNTVLHAEVGPDARTVLVSLTSLVAFAGSAVGGLAVPAAAGALGTGVGLVTGAAAMLVGAVPLVGLERRGRVGPD